MLRLSVLAALTAFAGVAHADLNDSLQEYTRTASGILSQLETLRDNAGACGFIGRFVAGRMPESVSQQRRQMSVVTSNAKKGQAGRSAIEAEVAKAEDGNRELLSNENMVRNGLSTDSPACQKALSAFNRLKPLSLASPGKMRRLINDL